MWCDLEADIDGEVGKGQFAFDVLFGFFSVAILVDEVLLDLGHQLHILQVAALLGPVGETLHILQDIKIQLDLRVVHTSETFFLLVVTSDCQF